jgi:hypothetical protein
MFHRCFSSTSIILRAFGGDIKMFVRLSNSVWLVIFTFMLLLRSSLLSLF